MTSYEGLGIAIIVFYIPAVVIALYLVIQHGRPKMPWVTLLLFSCARLASGIVLIPWSLDPSNAGTAAAADLLINVGVVPLLVSTIGQLRIIHTLGFPDSEILRKTIALTRVVILVGVGLLVAGAVLSSVSPDAETIRTGLGLGKAGYFVIVAVIISVFIIEVALVWWIPRSSPAVKISFTAVAIAIPFQIVRIIYALLGLFGLEAFMPLQGRIGVLVGLCLISEYVVVVLYGLSGWLIRPHSSISKASKANRGLGKSSADKLQRNDQDAPPAYSKAGEEAQV